MANYLEEQARKKFQQHISHQKQYANVADEVINGPGFAFKLPQYAGFTNVNENIEFAATPFDPRYYEPSPPQQQQNFDDFDDQTVDDGIQIESDVKNIPAPVNENRNKILIPSPMHVNDAPSSSSETQRILHRNQQKQLQQQLLNNNNNKASDVMQKPLQVEFDNTTSLYIVALIAGLSCAFSTGVSFPRCYRILFA